MDSELLDQLDAIQVHLKRIADALEASNKDRGIDPDADDEEDQEEDEGDIWGK
jgi:hypothetical protein